MYNKTVFKTFVLLSGRAFILAEKIKIKIKTKNKKIAIPFRLHHYTCMGAI